MERMSALKDKLKDDLAASMKARDEVRVRTIRMALAAINVEEVSGKQARELSDDEVIKVLTRERRSAVRPPTPSPARDGRRRPRGSWTSRPSWRSTSPRSFPTRS